MDNAEPQLEQIDGLWIDGAALTCQAAAILRSDKVGPHSWQMLIFAPSARITGDDLRIRTLTRDGVKYVSRGRVEVTIEKPRAGSLPSVLLQGTQSLVVVHQA